MATSESDQSSQDDETHPSLAGHTPDPSPDGMSSLTRIHTNTIIEEHDQSELRRIATALSDRHQVPTANDEDIALQPQSSHFDLSKWLQNFIGELKGRGHTDVRAGIVYKDLDVFGNAPDLQVQQTVASFLKTPMRIGRILDFKKLPPKKILQNFNGVLQGGELLAVLGRPGSGCSTLLKTMCGELHGLTVDVKSVIHYNGVPQRTMIKEFKGEVIYNQEVDKHFPELTVGQTLEFAASARMPSNRYRNMSRKEAAKYVAQVVMAVCGLRHTYDTKVGNEFIRGVSGGERKRVSIAEMMVAGSPICAWDNSTRGLDSATALKFVETLRIAADLANTVHAVAIYQASESIYELFDKVTVLYEGRQIFFGPATVAKAFFERQGWQCPQRQTTADFLTSLTNPVERKARPGMEDKVPRTVEEFETYWRASPEFEELQAEINKFEEEYPIAPDGSTAALFQQKKNFKQAKHVRPKSPYMISISMQIAYNTRRAYQRIWNNPAPTITTAVTCLILALIIGSTVYGTPDATSGFFAKGSVLFMAVLLNALITITEINSLYAQRPIVEKHASYAFYHPATEAMAGIIADVPIKFLVACMFNVALYFMAGLRREPSQFFIYFLFSYIATMTMGAIFRTMAAMTKTISQAMSLAGIFILALVVYTGFVIAVPEMHPWFSWIRWINPLFYAFEALIANEFHGREFTCSIIIPGYSPPIGDSWICSVVGAVAGQPTVSGDSYIEKSFRYSYSHIWRNFGILICFLVFFMLLYLIASEVNTVPASSGEMLVYQEGHIPTNLRSAKLASADEEKVSDSGTKTEQPGSDVSIHGIPPQESIFTWSQVIYDIEVHGQKRRLLDHVSGWVKPGTLTALMGVSGAGKTTLLDVLANRTSIGVITGDMLIDGVPRKADFQRNTGYIQQQDLHLETATVRESLRFSAMLRQPQNISKEEKYRFVEEVIKMLDMEDFADAVVGIPGEGLNIEQRKLLTIGVELAAKPKLLLFLDEPTSGLDSQSSWAICHLLRKLANAGQAVLCTIHQPSAVLFEHFDRLLLLAAGGRTVYFGEIGNDSRTLLQYFHAKGARQCGDTENPAEYILEVINKSTDSQGQDWPTAWQSSAERNAVDMELERINDTSQRGGNLEEKPDSESEFAMPFSTQLRIVTHRIFQQYWRMPSYIFSKIILGIAAGLFIGFSFFGAKDTIAGTQNIIFAVFQLVTIFTTLVQQIQPLFVTQRSLYEVRERPGKMYSWKAFILANIIVEFPWQILTGVITYACFYYPVIGVQSSERQVLVLLFIIQLFIYASSFAHMCIAALPDAQTAGGIVTLLVMISLIFCGVLQTPTALPGFWIFMYRVSPFTYWVSGVISTQVHGRVVDCSTRETSIFDPPTGYTCGQYLQSYLQLAPGQLQNPMATSGCRYCQLSTADQYLESSRIYWDDRWRNFGLLWGYVAFNIFAAVVTYYIFRVKKWAPSGLTLKKDQ